MPDAPVPENDDDEPAEALPVDAADPRQPRARRRDQIGSAGGGPYAAGRPEDQRAGRRDRNA
jgi:hypothetical protein